jgi:hypothetical protein
MPYLKVAQTDTLTLPSDSAYTVVMKARASFGDVEAARSAMVKVSATAAGLTAGNVEVAAYTAALVLALVTSWNLTDETDAPLAITARNLAKLDPADGDFLAAEAQKRAELRPEAREIPFGSTSTSS